MSSNEIQEARNAIHGPAIAWFRHDSISACRAYLAALDHYAATIRADSNEPSGRARETIEAWAVLANALADALADIAASPSYDSLGDLRQSKQGATVRYCIKRAKEGIALYDSAVDAQRQQWQ